MTTCEASIFNVHSLFVVVKGHSKVVKINGGQENTHAQTYGRGSIIATKVEQGVDYKVLEINNISNQLPHCSQGNKKEIKR